MFSLAARCVRSRPLLAAAAAGIRSTPSVLTPAGAWAPPAMVQPALSVATRAMSTTVFKSPHPDVNIPDITLSEYLFRVLDAHPNNVCLIDSYTDRQLTCSDVRDLVEKTAAGLAAEGLKKGETFAMFIPNMVEFPIVLHGAVAAGGIVTTANPTYSVEELVHQLSDSGAQYLITVPGLLETARAAIREHPVRKVFVIADDNPGGDEALFSDLLQFGNTVPQVNCDIHDVCLLPYSSGTTGLPKGVMLTHHNMVSNTIQVEAVDDLENEVLLGLLPMFHIYGMMIANIALAVGVPLVIMPKFELEHFLNSIQKYKISYAHIAPPLAVALAKHPMVDQFDLSSLKTMISGAAPLGPDTEAEASARTGAVVRQAYGMTEMSPASHFSVTPTPGSIGPLVANTEAKVIDVVTLEALPEGKEGEVCIRGPQVMKGYHNRDEEFLTADGFLRTGDIGYVQDGLFYITDRLKELIKYKGYQVAPAELENVLLKHPSIADAAVIGVPDESAGELPRAFVVLKQGQEASVEDIQEFVASHVAPHKKLRGGVEFLEAIPKSASGKILRRELRAHL